MCLRPYSMYSDLSNQWPHLVNTLPHCHRELSGWFISASMPFFFFWMDRAGKSKSRIGLAGWTFAQNSNVVARKRLGHFTVSSQEEQIASALHDHSRDWPERGLCSPGGEAIMAWLGCTGWHVVWSNWDRGGVGGCTFCCRPFPLSLQPHSCSSGMHWRLWCHSASLVTPW